MTESALNQVTRDQAIKDLITPNGKQLGIYHVKNTALYKVAFQSGGELPKELEGMWTDTSRAHDAAQKYLKKRWDEAEKPSKGPGRPKKEESENASQ